MLHPYKTLEILVIHPTHSIARSYEEALQVAEFESYNSEDPSKTLMTTFIVTSVLLLLSVFTLMWGTAKVTESATVANQTPIPAHTSSWERLK